MKSRGMAYSIKRLMAGLLTLSVVLVLGLLPAMDPADASGSPSLGESRPLPGTKVPMVTVAAGATSGVRALTTAVVRTPAQWQSLWERHTSGGVRRTMPQGDFTREMIIAVFGGKLPAPARASIVAVLRRGDRVVVVFRVGVFEPGPVVAQSPGETVTPFHIVKVPRSDLPVVFVRGKSPELYQPARP